MGFNGWFAAAMRRGGYFLGQATAAHSMVVVTAESQYIGYWIGGPPT